MSLPESMSRIVIVGVKSRMEEAIETFYGVGALHLIDHTTGADGLSIGTTVKTNAKATERLLKVRAMEKDLGIDKHTKADAVPTEEIKSQIKADSVENVEAEVMAVLDRRNDLNHRITDLNSKKKSLELLARIDVPLELYSGYKAIASVVGSVKADPAAALAEFADIEVFSSVNKEGGVVAAFCRTADRDRVASKLSDCGFTEIHVPAGTGSPSAALAQTDSELADLNAKLQQVEEEIQALQMKHKTFLKASDEELAIEIEMGEVPLKTAVTEYSFILDAWVPTKKVEAVKTEIESRMGDGIYVEVQETRGRSAHESEEVEDRFKTVPTKFNNGKITKEFQYPTKLVSVPKYNEIDPSILIMIFLPMMFGFMVGDAGYAIPFIILGAYGLKKTHHKDWRAIAVCLFFGGIWAFLFGMFFFGEALGMHFVTGNLEDTIWGTGKNVTWEGLFFGASTGNFPSWFTGLLYEGSGVGKLHAVVLLLKLSVYVGIVHLMIGYICGFYNKLIQHGFKEAFIEKMGWIFSFVGMVVLCWALCQILEIVKHPSDLGMTMLIVAVVLLVIGIAINFKREKIQSIMELPGIVGNILSYTRLAAIGMSKAGMALAFNYIVFGMIIGVQNGDVSIIMVVLGILMFAFLHLVIWTLAILSGGLHALRLQFVELMTKFFDGGGVEFKPLKIKRKQTVSSQTVSIDNTTKEV